jgi:hypothetical protein
MVRPDSRWRMACIFKSADFVVVVGLGEKTNRRLAYGGLRTSHSLLTTINERDRRVPRHARSLCRNVGHKAGLLCDSHFYSYLVSTFMAGAFTYRLSR